MPINLEQKVFPFLEDDPHFQAARHQEHTVQEALCRFRGEFDRQLNERVRHAVDEALQQLRSQISEMRDSFERMQTAYYRGQDDADWWKYGTLPDKFDLYDGDDVPF